MKTKLFIAFLSISIIATSCGKKTTSGTDKFGEIELKLNLPKGKKYLMKMAIVSDADMTMMAQNIKSTTTMDMTLDYEVKDILANGNFLIRTTFKTVRMKQEVMGMKMEFDSETGKSSGAGIEQMSSGIKKMIGSWTEIEMDKTGKTIKTTHSDPTADGSAGIESYSFSSFPTKKLKVGDTWETDIEQNMKKIVGLIKSKYKLIGVKDGIAEISIDGTMALKPGEEGKLSGIQKGTTKIEISTGLGTEMNMEQNMEIEVNDMGMKMPAKLKNKIVITIN